MNPTATIRAAVEGDQQALALVGAATFLDAFAGVLDGPDIVAHCQSQHSVDVYANWLRDETASLWMAATDLGGAAVGYAVLCPADLPLADLQRDDWEIKRIYVLSRFQGAGLGRRMIDLAAADAVRRGGRRLLLGVYGRNEQAIGFYRHMGFQTVGARRFRVGRQEHDDLVMGLTLQ